MIILDIFCVIIFGLITFGLCWAFVISIRDKDKFTDLLKCFISILFTLALCWLSISRIIDRVNGSYLEKEYTFKQFKVKSAQKELDKFLIKHPEFKEIKE